MDRNITAVVFDMDGLMFNTEDLYDQVGQQLLERRGLSFTLELKLQMMGLPGGRAFEVMIQQCGLTDSVQQLQEESDRIFVDLLPNQIAKMPGLDSLLQHLEDNRIPKAVATSSHQQFADTALGVFELGPRFKFVLTAEDVIHGKPHPDIYLLAAARLGIPPAEMLVLEDSLTGSRAAVAAGAYTVAVPSSHTRHLSFEHADIVISSLDSPVLREILKR